MVSVCPAIVARIVRGVTSGFGGIVTMTDPLPEPFGGDAPRSGAVQPQAGPDALMVIDAVPPDAGAERTAGLIVNAHADPNCVIVYVAPFTVIVPLRELALPLADTL